jgi:ketosteroid isomerase-like protein
MNTQPAVTEAIVRNHLQAFVEQKGIDAILSDYDDNARFHSEAKMYQGKQEIGEFFAGFIAALPAGATKRFALRTLRVDGELAYITWSAGREIPSARTPSSFATAKSSHRHSRRTPRSRRSGERMPGITSTAGDLPAAASNTR